jgi:hypothetical protein
LPVTFTQILQAIMILTFLSYSDIPSIKRTMFMWSRLDFEAPFVRKQEIPNGGEADIKLEQTSP